MKIIILLFLLVSKSVIAQKVDIFFFDENEVDNQQSHSRILFGKDQMRIDNGAFSDGYIIYNAQQQKIYSVSHQDKTILLIKSKEQKLPADAKPDFQHKQKLDKKAPEVAGQKLLQNIFGSSQKICGGSYTLKNRFARQLELLQGWQKLLQEDAAANLHKTPKEFQTPCYLNNFVYHAVDYYQHGFPVVIWREDGYKKLLKDYKLDQQVDKKLFELPKNYQTYSIAE